MAGYTPITSADDLPKPGVVLEHLHLDFKAYKGARPLDREMAKDVAAFANAHGGVVLIGATHDDGFLWEYSPLDQEPAREVADDHRRAVQRYCKPHAVVDVRAIPIDGGLVVAVNVPPYPAPPIGVRSEEKHDAWLFPARRGDHTHFLLPEELATLMDPVYRRRVLQVQGIPKREGGGHPCLLHFIDAGHFSKHERGVRFPAGTGVNAIYRAQIVDIDPVAGVMVVKGDNPSRIVIPLDALRGVWKGEDDTDHQVAIKGVLADEGNRY